MKKRIILRIIIITCLVIALLTIAVGAILAHNNILIDWNFYRTMVAYVGSFSSILGLIGLIVNPLKSIDLKQLNSEGLKELAESAEKIQKQQKEIQETNVQLEELKIKKNDLELLVEQASLGIFYNKELKRSYDKLSKLIESKKDIQELIQEIQCLENDLNDLNVKIEENKEIKEMITILQEADNLRKRRLRNEFGSSFLDNIISNLMPTPFNRLYRD